MITLSIILFILYIIWSCNTIKDLRRNYPYPPSDIGNELWAVLHIAIFSIFIIYLIFTYLP